MKDMKFWIFPNFQRNMNMQMISSPHNLSCILHLENFSFFAQICKRMSTPHIIFSWLKYGIFVISVNKIQLEIVRRWHHQLTHLQIISTVQIGWDENYGNSNFHIFLIFYPIYTKFSLFCLKKIAFSIDLNLDSIFPLNPSNHFNGADSYPWVPWRTC